MKNLAKCKPSEFLKQTVKIKRTAERWLKVTDVMSIRKEQPDLVAITEDMAEEERRAALRANREKREAKVAENLSRMFDAIADEHPEETLELLAMMCFVEPEDVDAHPIDEYMGALSEMLNNENVRGFFSSLLRLVQ